jgi:hypothetical protein
MTVPEIVIVAPPNLHPDVPLGSHGFQCLETMIAVAEDDLKIKIRKKRGTKQSKE